MNTNKSSSYLQQFSWEEWDNQMIAVLYRSDRRFVVKRYIERVLANSPLWQRLAKTSFANIQPITQAYSMNENEVKLMHHIFSWHLNGTLTFPIIGGLDQLVDWEDILDFIERAQQTVKNNIHTRTDLRHSPSIVPTIPIGTLLSTMSNKKTEEKNSNIENIDPIKSNKKTTVDQQDQLLLDEPSLSTSSKNYWVQINNICVPYIIKSQQIRYLPYEVLIDCNLFNEHEQAFLMDFTIKATINDIETFERIVSSSSSIDFKLNHNLHLIDLYHVICGMSKVVYIKLLHNQRDVNKSYKTVLAQVGGIALYRSHSIPFISLNKHDFILLDSINTILQPSSRSLSSLRRRGVPAQVHEIDYLRLIQFYQRNNQQDDQILLNQQQPHLLINLNEIQKYVEENGIVTDMSLSEYQQNEYRKLKKQIGRKTSKRKLLEHHRSTN